MRAWTVDADDIQIADDLGVTLLHRTPWIDSFLEQKRSCDALPESSHYLLHAVLTSLSQVWVTEGFKEALERTPSFYHAEAIDPGVRAELRSADGAFNVKKTGSAEPDHFLRLFRI